MNSLEVLYYTLTGAIVVFVAVVIYVSYNLVATLRSFRHLAEQGSDITESIQSVKSTLRLDNILPLVFGAAGLFGRKLVKKIF